MKTLFFINVNQAIFVNQFKKKKYFFNYFGEIINFGMIGRILAKKINRCNC